MRLAKDKFDYKEDEPPKTNILNSID